MVKSLDNHITLMYPYCVMISAIHTHQTLRTPTPPPVCPHRSAKGSLGERTISEPLPGAARFQRAPACHHWAVITFTGTLLFSTLLYFSLPYSPFGSLSSESQSILSAQGADMAIVRNQFQSILREERTGKVIASYQFQFNCRYATAGLWTFS